MKFFLFVLLVAVMVMSGMMNWVHERAAVKFERKR